MDDQGIGVRLATGAGTRFFAALSGPTVEPTCPFIEWVSAVSYRDLRSPLALPGPSRKFVELHYQSPVYLDGVVLQHRIHFICTFI